MKKQATTPRVLEIDPLSHIYFETTQLRVFGNVCFISKGRLPPEGDPGGIGKKKKENTPRVLEIETLSHMYSEATLLRVFVNA